ncbi:MAG: tRNA dimethylallyltransferase [Verrucomicrobiota bacterium]|jgi:tRNA dimethylallyltransferase
MKGVFFIVGPTAVGKSGLAADVGSEVDGEIVNADAFQIYEGFGILSAKPDRHTLTKVPHHLIGSVPPSEEMNAAKFRSAALRAIEEIQSRGRLAIVVGGSGLYVKALTHGLSDVPAADAQLRDQLNTLSLGELRNRLVQLDPKAAEQIDLKNRRRVIRALEICLLTGRPVSIQRANWVDVPGSPAPSTTDGVFVFRDREDLHARIEQRVESMFEEGAVAEVAKEKAISSTAEKMIGVRQIRDHLEGKLPLAECVAAIKRATRRYAKRQLTWFRRQPNFEPLNLTGLSHKEAGEWVSRRALARRAKG